MRTMRTEENFVQFETEHVLHAADALIAVSSILSALADQYAATGQLSVGALLHASNVIDNTVERLNLAELVIKQTELPF